MYMLKLNTTLKLYGFVIITCVISTLITLKLYQQTLSCFCPKNIASVHVSQIINDYTKALMNTKIDPTQTKLQTQQFSYRLDRALQTLAKHHHATLLISEAVIAGNEDLTNELQSLLKT